MMEDEADRLIALAIRDAREPAPAHLHRTLARRHLPRARPAWLVPALSAFGGALVAAAILLVILLPRTATTSDDDDPVIAEAIGDHLRVVSTTHALGVETNNLHNVKPWFAGKLDFVPPVDFLGDDDFPLKGGDVAIFLGHRAATFAYAHRLHAISLFVAERAGEVPMTERTLHGFHAIAWQTHGFAFAIVSDLNMDELRTFALRLHPPT